MKALFAIFFTFSLLSANSPVFAQADVTDSCIAINFVQVHYGLQLPGADMADRFGFNSNAGTSFYMKLRNNWFFGADFCYIFGNNVKDSLFEAIETEDHYIIDGNGTWAELFIYERGYYTTLQFGKIWNFLDPNPNSGFTTSFGVGFMQHKIRIENPENTAPQITGEYRKGYDRLSNGIALNQFIGFTLFSSQRLFSFRIGLEFTEAFTQNRRSYDYVLMAPMTGNRIDFLYGIRFDWMLPFYRGTPSQYYYN